MTTFAVYAYRNTEGPIIRSMQGHVGRRCRVWSGATKGQWGVVVGIGGRRHDMYCVRLDSGQYRLKSWTDVQLVSHSQRNRAPAVVSVTTVTTTINQWGRNAK